MDRFTEHLRALAAILESAASGDRAEQLASRAMARARNPQAQARRAVGVLAGIALGAFGLLGVGALSDSSVPGQFLYPVDRAFESMTGLVGVDTGGSEERLAEAIVLLYRGDRGDDLRAAELIDEAIEAVSKETGLDGQLTGLVSSPVTTITLETGPIVLPADTEDEPVVVAVAPPEEEPPAVTLRLAAEALLRTVQEAKESGGSEEAAGKLVEAASDAKAAATQIIVLSAAEPVDETTTTSSTSTTTSSVPGKKPTTSTTLPDGGSTSTTTSVPEDDTMTTTTVPGNGSTTTTSTTEPGPIILPPQG